VWRYRTIATRLLVPGLALLVTAALAPSRALLELPDGLRSGSPGPTRLHQAQRPGGDCCNKSGAAVTAPARMVMKLVEGRARPGAVPGPPNQYVLARPNTGRTAHAPQK
jgi:hypothetical protein